MTAERHEHFLNFGKNVGYDDAKREYFIVAKNLGDGAFIINAIRFCPICGKEFPPSLREEWFDQLEAIGIDPLNDPVPHPYADGTWWRTP